jgi:hypothetical protein
MNDLVCKTLSKMLAELSRMSANWAARASAAREGGKRLGPAHGLSGRALGPAAGLCNPHASARKTRCDALSTMHLQETTVNRETAAVPACQPWWQRGASSRGFVLAALRLRHARLLSLAGAAGTAKGAPACLLARTQLCHRGRAAQGKGVQARRCRKGAAKGLSVYSMQPAVNA